MQSRQILLWAIVAVLAASVAALGGSSGGLLAAVAVLCVASVAIAARLVLGAQPRTRDGARDGKDAR